MKILGLNITRAPQRKESPTWPAILAFLAGQATVYTPKDYAKLAEAGYQNCAPAFAAISLIARSAAGVRWFSSRKRSDGTLVELDKSRFTNLLAHPNEYDDGYRFVESIVSYKLMAGNSYIHKVHGLPSEPPRFLYTLRPDRMTVKAGDSKGLVRAYAYEANGIKVPLDSKDTLHLRDFHPLHDFYGLSRLEVAATSIDLSNWSQEWNLNSLQNDMRIPGVLQLNGVNDEQSKKIRAQIKNEHSGAMNVDKALVLENLTDSKWTPMAMTPKDADWGEAEKRNLRRICAIFNVWSGLLGDTESTTYSNYQEGRKALYQEAVLPELDGLKNALNSWLGPFFGDEVLDYDRDKIEALQEDRGIKYAYLNGAKFLTVNEKRAECGFEEIGPEGDVVLVGIGDIPLSDAVATIGPGDAVAKSFRPLKTKSLGGFWRGETERKALWQNFERRVAAKERVLVREMQSYLKAQAEGVVAKAGQGIALVDSLLNRDEAEKSYVTRFKPRYAKLFVTALVAGRRMTEGKLYDFVDDDKADEPGISDALRKKLEKLIEETAKVITDETLSEIQAVLRDATGTNLTVQEIANALKDKLIDQMSPVRARRIARTETAMLENFGNLEGFKEMEFVNRKMWVAQPTEFSRDAHLEADGQEVGIDETFKVGGEEMEYPLDRTHGATAGNIINCNCTEAPVVE